MNTHALILHILPHHAGWHSQLCAASRPDNNNNNNNKSKTVSTACSFRKYSWKQNSVLIKESPTPLEIFKVFNGL